MHCVLSCPLPCVRHACVWIPYRLVGGRQGFKRVKDNLEDVCLDNPQGQAQLQAMVDAGLSQGWLDEDWDLPPPFSIRASLSLGSPTSTQVLGRAHLCMRILLSRRTSA